MTIILATNNAHKRDELWAVLRRELGYTIALKTLDDAGLQGIEIPETGVTLEENALIKARAIHLLTHQPTIADDTGLEVAALHGAPGVYSARYAGEDVSYDENVEKLLNEMFGKDERGAAFRTVLAFIDEQGAEHLFEGRIEGEITRVRRGENGFGYDPIFAPILEGTSTRTFAEMTTDEKNRVSHRARAIEGFAASLKGARNNL